jgi:hypothetical protein
MADSGAACTQHLQHAMQKLHHPRLCLALRTEHFLLRSSNRLSHSGDPFALCPLQPGSSFGHLPLCFLCIRSWESSFRASPTSILRLPILYIRGPFFSDFFHILQNVLVPIVTAHPASRHICQRSCPVQHWARGQYPCEAASSSIISKLTTQQHNQEKKSRGVYPSPVP